MKPSILTFWDDFITREGTQLLENTDPYPLLIGIHIKVTKYNGFSLSSRAGSSFVINPDTIAAHSLKTWCIANKEKVEQLCDQFLAKPIIQIVPEPQDKDITPITKVPKTPETVERKEYWIQSKISIVSLDQNFWYMSSSNCRKAISANKETLFDCIQCNSKKVMAKPSSMTATMFENHAEQYFLVDGKILMKYASKEDENVVAIFPKLAIENQNRIQLKPREYPSHGVKLLSYNINSIKPALSEDNSKEDQPTNTKKAPSVPTKAKKKLFQADDNPTTTSKEIYESP